jgi:hypothetical protein
MALFRETETPLYASKGNWLIPLFPTQIMYFLPNARNDPAPYTVGASSMLPSLFICGVNVLKRWSATLQADLV